MMRQIVVPMAMLMMLSCAGLTLAQPATAEPPAQGKMAQMGKVETSSPTRLHHLTGEVVAVDRTAKTVTIKHMVGGKAREATFNVAEKAAASLANLQPNDRVSLSYSKEQGRLMAQSIVETYHKVSK
jgi:Cu/Ag efflux protein CusF